MLRIEFHCHTRYSKDSLTLPGSLIDRCQKLGIDRLAITDHNTITGALEAAKLDPDRIIIGEEIMTTEGELLAFFMIEEIPPHLSPEKTIELLRQQNAFISVSHPFDAWRSGHWKQEDLLRITPLIDAIEIFNARCMQPKFNELAHIFAQEHNLSGTVGSDAHTSSEVGKATLSIPDFTDSQSLRDAIIHAIPRVSLSSWLIHLTSRYAVIRKKMLSMDG